MITKLMCTRGGDRFTINKTYDLFNGYITDDFGIRWVYGSWDKKYKFVKII